MFWGNSLAFSMIPWMLAIWSLVPLPFLNPACTFGSSPFKYCWSLAWRMLNITLLAWGFPGSSAGKESACNAGDPSSIPGSGWSPGEGVGYPLQYSWTSLVGSAGKESTCNARDLRPAFNPQVGKIPWRRERLPTPVIWPGKFHVLYSSWGGKELDTTEWLYFLSLY